MMASRASSAEEDLEYLQNTMPFDGMRSILQYSKSLNWDIASCTQQEGLYCQVPEFHQLLSLCTKKEKMGKLQAFTSIAVPLAVFGTTMKRRERGGMLSGSGAHCTSDTVLEGPDRLHAASN
jgi:hypothetical protein